MKLSSRSFAAGDRIPPEFAFAAPDVISHISLSTNRNPHLTWSDVPEGTGSFVLVCQDPDAPATREDVNVEGRFVSADRARGSFVHWLLLDIPAETTEIAAGSHSAAVTARGKSGPGAGVGIRHGINDYTNWFVGDPDMEGTYFGYDGPCPPWNDMLPHRYVFTIYALATPTLRVDEPLTGANVVRELAEAEVLGSAELVGWYSLNPDVSAPPAEER